MSDPNRSAHLEPEAAEPTHPHKKLRSFGPGTHTIQLQVGNLRRHYTVHVPPELAARTPLPIVLFLHGGGGHALASIRETRWTDKADREGFLAAFLDARPWGPSRPASFRTNPRLWNDTSGRTQIARFDADDVAYVGAALDDLAGRFAVDPRRVYCSGFSNGGGMTFRVAAELAHRIAAIATVSAYFYLPNPQPSRPVPLLYMIGTLDPMVPHLGGVSRSPWGNAGDKKPVRLDVEKYARLLGCPIEPQVVSDEKGVHVERYGPGREDSEAIFVTVEGMGHLWPGGRNGLPETIVGPPTDKIVANDVIWDFFLKHPMR